MLNEAEEWIGFFGDSEYEKEDGEIRMGNWALMGTFDKIIRDFHLELDDDILDDKLTGLYIVKNDNGTVCLVKLMYDD